MASAHLRWTPQAQQDVQRVFRFLALKNDRAARRAVAIIRHEVQKLVEFPQAGRPIEELGHQYRELIVPFGDGGYVVLYRYEGGEVQVLRTRHQREAGY